MRVENSRQVGKIGQAERFQLVNKDRLSSVQFVLPFSSMLKKWSQMISNAKNVETSLESDARAT